MKKHVVKTKSNLHFNYNRKQYRILRFLHPFYPRYVYSVEYKAKSILFGEKWKSLFTTGEEYYFDTLEEAEQRLKEYTEIVSTYDYGGKQNV